MYTFEQSAGQVIAADTQNSVAAVDQAIMSYARQCASIVEVSNASKLPVTTCQSALASVVEGLSNIVAGRANIAAATRELLKIQKNSNLDTLALGCPNGFPEPTGRLNQPIEKAPTR